MERIKLAVLISGRGSNLQSIIDACEQSDFPAEISVVVSNKADAYGLVRAKLANLETAVVEHKKFIDRETFEIELQLVLSPYEIDLICLAGFMRVLSGNFVNNWPEKIINIHPSLLPKFKGLDTHARAIKAKEDMSGCTVHFVTPDMDSGPIILQRCVPIAEGETPETLAAKILAEEHVAYPEAIRLISASR